MVPLIFPVLLHVLRSVFPNGWSVEIHFAMFNRDIYNPAFCKRFKRPNIKCITEFCRNFIDFIHMHKQNLEMSIFFFSLVFMAIMNLCSLDTVILFIRNIAIFSASIEKGTVLQFS